MQAQISGGNFEHKSEVFILVVWLDFYKDFLFKFGVSLAWTVPEPFPTNSLLLPPGSDVQRKIYTTSAKRKFTDRMGWIGYQKCPIFFILFWYIKYFYTYYLSI